MRRPITRSIVMALCFLGLASCQGAPRPVESERTWTLRLATTTSTEGSGLLDVLLPEFEKLENIRVEVLSMGTGAALDLAREGGADVVLVHARQEEDRFIQEGYGINRHDVMYNDFVILGPVDDPAGIGNEKDLIKVMWRIAEGQFPFLSRGDQSGTHLRERQIWELAGIVPSGEWYAISHAGMLETLRQASEGKRYVISDRSTYAYNADDLQLKVLFHGDRRLFNPYGVIAVNPARVPGAHFEEAMRFVEFITSERGQALIGDFGRDRVGFTLFEPMAIPRIAGSPDVSDVEPN